MYLQEAISVVPESYNSNAILTGIELGLYRIQSYFHCIINPALLIILSVRNGHVSTNKINSTSSSIIQTVTKMQWL